MPTEQFRCPAFINYSSVDNQRWAKWLNEFDSVFADGLSAELSVEGMDSAQVFFDVDQLEGKTDTVESDLQSSFDSSFALSAFDHQRLMGTGRVLLLVTCLCLASYQDADAQTSKANLLETFASNLVGGGRLCTLYIKWTMDGELYQGQFVMQGGTGRLNLETPMNVVQTVRTKWEGNEIFLFGSDPRDAKSRPIQDYSPDNFILTREHGEWDMRATCDANDINRCAKVNVIKSSCY